MSSRTDHIEQWLSFVHVCHIFFVCLFCYKLGRYFSISNTFQFSFWSILKPTISIRYGFFFSLQKGQTVSYITTYYNFISVWDIVQFAIKSPLLVFITRNIYKLPLTYVPIDEFLLTQFVPLSQYLVSFKPPIMGSSALNLLGTFQTHRQGSDVYLTTPLAIILHLQHY